DLPVILWWPGRPQFDNPLFDDLCELADRLVIDTDEGFDDADLKRLLEVARRHKAQASIGDLNWARLIAWRHVAAQLLDMPGERDPARRAGPCRAERPVGGGGD